jgi:hypothetical protein
MALDLPGQERGHPNGGPMYIGVGTLVLILLIVIIVLLLRR